MVWTSETNQFDESEMTAIEGMEVPSLALAISNSPPVVALRVLAEVHLHDDMPRLTELLADEAVNATWTQYRNDIYIDSRDHAYAKRLAPLLPSQYATLAAEFSAYRYPREDPHWIHATRVLESSMSGYVNVWIGEKEYRMQRIGWSNPQMDKSKSDCLVEDTTIGWLRIWWNNSDVSTR